MNHSTKAHFHSSLMAALITSVGCSSGDLRSKQLEAVAAESSASVTQALTMNASAPGLIPGGSGNDIIDTGAGNDLVYGRAGDDVMDSGDGDDLVDAGPGIDNVFAGDGNDRVVIHNLCEVGEGEVLDGGPGTDTLVTPVPLAELTQMGVTVRNFETIRVDASSCESECVAKPLCSGNGICTGSSPAGGVACSCNVGWAGEDCSYSPLCDTDDCCVGPSRNQCLCDNQGGKWENGSCCVTPQCKCEAVGNVWANGSCHPPGVSTSIVNPSYYILSLMYAPPGAGSRTSYGKASAIVTRTATTFDSKVSAVAEVNSSVTDSEIKIGVGRKTGSSTETSTIRGSGIESVRNVDGVDHRWDQFLIWANPELHVTQDGLGNITTVLTGPLGASTALVTVYELITGMLSTTNSDKLINVLSSDRHQILRAHPWVDFSSGEPTVVGEVDLWAMPNRRPV
jgi:hypothetical protein